jgi:leucine-rich repeat protein SHOC2
LPRLAELNISGNRLETFPSLYWDDIKILDVSRNEVKSISTEALKTATSLETVNIKCNAVSCLPEELGQLSHLKELCLDYNKLQSLPDCEEDEKEEEKTDENEKKSKGCWAKLKCLEILKVSYNKLKSVPCQLARAKALTHIDASGNMLEKVPGCLGGLTDLRELRLQQNRLIKLPFDLFRAGNKLRVLHLNNNQITKLPSSIRHLTLVEDIRLANNELEDIPEEIGSCTKLVRLDLNHNKLKSLPESIGKLTTMTRLNVSHNDLADRLPKSLENCVELRELLASNNPRLEHVMDTFEFVTKLEWLDVSCCAIESVDSSIGTCCIFHDSLSLLTLKTRSHRYTRIHASIQNQ